MLRHWPCTMTACVALSILEYHFNDGCWSNAALFKQFLQLISLFDIAMRCYHTLSSITSRLYLWHLAPLRCLAGAALIVCSLTESSYQRVTCDSHGMNSRECPRDMAFKMHWCLTKVCIIMMASHKTSHGVLHYSMATLSLMSENLWWWQLGDQSEVHRVEHIVSFCKGLVAHAKKYC